MKRIGSTAVVCAVALCGVVLSACGSDDSDDASSDGGAAPAKTTSTTKAASGDPLKVLVTSFANAPIGDVPQIWAGAEVAAENINAAGGVNGRPLEVVRCNGKGDPKAEQACARKAISEKVIAGASNVFAVNPQGAYEILSRAGIADVGGIGAHPALFSAPSEYPIEFGAASFNACVSPLALETAGDDVKVGVVVGQNPFAEGIFKSIEPYLKTKVADQYVGSVSVPPTQQDYRPVVQKLADKGANYIVVDIPPTEATRFVTAAGTAGKKWHMCADGGLFGPQLLEKLGPLTESFITETGVPPAHTGDKYPLVQQYVDEMKAAQEAGNKDADIQRDHVNSIRAWLAMQVVKQVASGIDGAVTTESFAKAMKTATVDLDYAKIDFSKPLGRPPLERVFHSEVFVTKWNNDTKALDDVGQVNVLELLAG